MGFLIGLGLTGVVAALGVAMSVLTGALIAAGTVIATGVIGFIAFLLVLI
jgi:hypothetical protein